MKTVYLLAWTVLAGLVVSVTTSSSLMIGDERYLAVGFWNHGRACDIWLAPELSWNPIQLWGDTITEVNAAD